MNRFELNRNVLLAKRLVFVFWFIGIVCFFFPASWIGDFKGVKFIGVAFLALSLFYRNSSITRSCILDLHKRIDRLFGELDKFGVREELRLEELVTTKSISGGDIKGHNQARDADATTAEHDDKES